MIHGSQWKLASPETIRLNSSSYSIPIKLNVSIHNVLVQAKHIYLPQKIHRKALKKKRKRKLNHITVDG